MVKYNFGTDIKTKANIFNNLFAEKCAPIKKDSVLSINQVFLTESRLSFLDLNENEILNIIYYYISIRMIKIRNKPQLQPLIFLFQDFNKVSCLIISYFFIKRVTSKFVKNYELIFLLPILGHIFGKIIFNGLNNFLLNERLLNPNQSGFHPSDSCVTQFFEMTCEIFEVFDCNSSLEVISVLLDISKSFDKVWHQHLRYKLKSMDISGDIDDLLENCFQN